MTNVAEDDQRLMQSVCQENPGRFLIDRECNVFIVICSPGRKINRRDERIVVRGNSAVASTGAVTTGAIIYNLDVSPCILHASGYTNIDDILYELGYRDVLYRFDEHESKRYIWKNMKHFGWWFIKYNWIYMMICVVIVIVFIALRGKMNIKTQYAGTNRKTMDFRW
jgi:hypothetical protein